MVICRWPYDQTFKNEIKTINFGRKKKNLATFKDICLIDQNVSIIVVEIYNRRTGIVHSSLTT